jgi:formiminoglutamase
MNLSIFFDTLPDLELKSFTDPHSLTHTLRGFRTEFPDVAGADVALIGLTEDRGNPAGQGIPEAAQKIREELYALQKGTGAWKVVDLGNLRNGPSLEETCMRIKEVTAFLIEKGVFPIFFGGSHDLDLGLFYAFEHPQKLCTMCTLDAYIDMAPPLSPASDNHSHRILIHEPNYLQHYCHIGYQRYLTDSETLSIMEKLYFETIRIGDVKQNLPEMEPSLRDADILSIDLNVLRRGDSPGNGKSKPFGLSAEELCQIAWYAGISPKLKTAGIFEYHATLDPQHQTAAIVATSIWYLIEGFYHRKPLESFDGPAFTQYIVPMSGMKGEMRFYKHLASEMWWMEVPSAQKETADSKVPCSYADYILATEGELPERWVLAQAKWTAN